MPKLVVYSLAILSILIILGGYVGWNFLKSNGTDELTPTQTSNPSNPPRTQTPGGETSTLEPLPDEDASPTQDPATILMLQAEQARNDGLMYLQTVHPEVDFLLILEDWQDGTASANSLQYDFSKGGWNVTIEASSTINATFTITIKYSGDWQVNWKGTDKEGTVTELTYTTNIPKLTPTPT